MLAKGLEFTFEEEVAAAYGIISQDTKNISEQLYSQFRAIEKLHPDMILGFDQLQSVNPQVDWVNYGITLKNGFIATGVPVYSNFRVELCSFKALIYLMHTNKDADSWFSFVQ